MSPTPQEVVEYFFIWKSLTKVGEKLDSRFPRLQTSEGLKQVNLLITNYELFGQ
ncbi:hypothetical protein GXM_03042 [Nostoc sphaeroides CCNUC1]|uniref:Uncharacterized protein n=1 Tax=Nostoc sphaeroides CCNUC1 TaxID=2653204 RepID=A0A5P8VYR6_9NOSO|nr:hypothetical protein GXM_03042 [Nostoc sphaeroides CCNUC1]